MLTAFLAHHFPKKEAAPVTDRAPVTPLDMDDYELLAKAMSAKDEQSSPRCGQAPMLDFQERPEADMALAGLLLFWTGGDQARTEAMMRRSGLAREKWDEARPGGTYLSTTIAKAAEGKTEFYSGKREKVFFDESQFERSSDDKQRRLKRRDAIGSCL